VMDIETQNLIDRLTEAFTALDLKVAEVVP
jgi:hypothetical protein